MMNKFEYSNCILIQITELNELKKYLKEYMKKQNNVIIKFSDVEITIIIDEKDLKQDYIHKNIKKQSMLILSNVEETNYKMKRLDELEIKEFEYLKKNQLMVMKKANYHNFYILNKKYYDQTKKKEIVDKIVANLKNYEEN